MINSEIRGAKKCLSEQIAEREKTIEKTNGSHTTIYNEQIDYANRVIQIEEKCRANNSDDYDLSNGIDFDLEILNDKTKHLFNMELSEILHSEMKYLTESLENITKQAVVDLPRENPVKELSQKKMYEDKSRNETYRHVLQGYGFLLSPENMPIAAVFPKNDWLELDSPEIEQEFENFRAKSECLMRKYKITTDERCGLLRGRDKNVGTRGLHKRTGCVCISWILLGAKTLASGGKKYVFAPVLGLSGSKPNAKNREDSLNFYNRMTRHCALPKIEKLCTTEVVLAESESRAGVNCTYQLMMERTQKLSLDYEIRKILGLRLPSRQAILSYIVFDYNHERVTDTSQENVESLQQPDFNINHWHSFNCAEPAAMTLASSVFCEGHDVTVCFPYEGKNYSPPHLPRPKETCEWCALVELAFRSIGEPDVSTPSGESEQVEVTEKLVTKGLPEILHKPRCKVDLFDEFKSARRNTNIFKNAYERSNLKKMGKIRKLFEAIGVLREDLIKEPKGKQLRADSIEI